ncbi:REP-associated tyrosine transposase [Massilia horti]|uniref:Transposase n=1 Tax=Massilia horti TaxID=2562153 RepID=A0A4Y9T2F1_9BURK|nr:transposase [Massilia horti]TFW31099.1 transposase [Massilia horti]
MSRYRRPLAGPAFFFTVVSYRRRPILCNESIRLALRSAIEMVRAVHPFSIDAWVLLPDHLHCVWTLPAGDSNFSVRWLKIKRWVSICVRDDFRDQRLLTRSSVVRRESTIWQRRFWDHRIRDDVDYGRHLDYVHINPVKHGHAKRAADWPYSTFGRYVREGVYPADWGGAADLSEMDYE